jgi:hypothetical protein
MDLKIQEDIQFEALSVYSTNLVKAREHLMHIRSKIDDPTTDINDVIKYKAKIENLIRQYNNVRMQQAAIKQSTLNSLYTKYPSISSNEIRQVLEDAVSEYENVSTDYIKFDDNGLIEEESRSITIPLYAKPNKYDIEVLAHIRNKLNNPSITMNEIHLLHNDLELAIKQYDKLRRQEELDRHNELNAYKQKLIMDTQIIPVNQEMRPVNQEMRPINPNRYNKYPLTDPKESVEITIPLYAKPTRTDMAVILVYFNACEYKKLAQNLLLTYQTLVRADIPVFLVEHCFKDQVPLFKENGTTIFNTKSDSYMFYKENLINWIMPKIPEQYTKFYIMDCDLLFENESWYDDVSALLDTHDVVQPFKEAIWLDSDLKTIDLKRDSFAYIHSINHIPNLSNHHPGFAWAARRDFIQPIGIFDLNILGAGDTIFCRSCLQIDSNNIENLWMKYANWCIPYYEDYYLNFKNVRTTYYSQNIYHLWHGSSINRAYNTRYQDFNIICSKYGIQTKDALFELNSYSLYEYNSEYREEFNNILLKYFKSRKEDGI